MSESTRRRLLCGWRKQLVLALKLGEHGGRSPPRPSPAEGEHIVPRRRRAAGSFHLVFQGFQPLLHLLGSAHIVPEAVLSALPPALLSPFGRRPAFNALL